MRAGIAFVLLLGGCRAHVHLDPPPPVDAPEGMRRTYYSSHRPEKPERGDFQMRSRIGEDRPSLALKAITLRNGLRIHHVEDLAPMVDDDSNTAAAIADALAARDTANLFTGAGVGVGLLGIGVGGALVVNAIFEGSGTIDAPSPTLIAGGATLAAGVLLGGGLAVWGMTSRDVEDDATTRAFRSFDADLRRRLALP